ncbi:hypothetical protein NC652_021807 [Populus alba x Populus x berolinensis]|uniref:Uncharacterized protein n=1 Tax=Populus alba x Populus x berolinensis TaxID=444605 RepID=A0AAD6QE31_9ROSI|nr:hypothetical protein NC652_021807 [Populus alba x Populus x berolinensis]KAJ6988704.1 hypothetical protein NC653_021587 [Populus alba x Populus x berolinensis]
MEIRATTNFWKLWGSSSKWSWWLWWWLWWFSGPTSPTTVIVNTLVAYQVFISVCERACPAVLMRFSEDFLLPAPGERLKLDDALWEWRRCSSSKVRSKGPLMAEPELPSGGLFSMEVFLALEVVNFSIILVSCGLMDLLDRELADKYANGVACLI